MLTKTDRKTNTQWLTHGTLQEGDKKNREGNLHKESNVDDPLKTKELTGLKYTREVRQLDTGRRTQCNHRGKAVHRWTESRGQVNQNYTGSDKRNTHRTGHVKIKTGNRHMIRNGNVTEPDNYYVNRSFRLIKFIH